jgi:hypothetical protein
MAFDGVTLREQWLEPGTTLLLRSTPHYNQAQIAVYSLPSQLHIQSSCQVCGKLNLRKCGLLQEHCVELAPREGWANDDLSSIVLAMSF